MEIKNISDAYESLVKHSHKRENLEKLMRFKLDTEMKKFKAVNHELKGMSPDALNITVLFFCKVSPSSAVYHVSFFRTIGPSSLTAAT